jgi:hypothetical protein
VELDLDTFLTAVYVVVDELYQEHLAPHKPLRRGHAAELSDSEVLTLEILAQWQGRRSEAAFLRYAVAHWQPYFPRLVCPEDFNRRARDLGGVLCALGPLIAARLAALLPAAPRYQVLDGVPVPLLRRCRGDRPKCFDAEAAVGRGGSDDDWYYGVCLVLCVDEAGSITGFVTGPANTGERWLAEALLRWRAAPTAPAPTAAGLDPVLPKSKERGGQRIGPTGPLGPWLAAGTPAPVAYLADLGFGGRHWQRHWQEHYDALVLTKRDFQALGGVVDPMAAASVHASFRQVVETTITFLDQFLGLKFPRARTYWGLITRLAAKVAAANLARYLNHCFGRSPFAAFDPLG